MKYKRYKIKDLIAITQPRSEKYCYVCGERVQGFAIIIYLSDQNIKLYKWLHFECIGQLGPIDPRTQKPSTNLFPENPCSYCGRCSETPLFNFDGFNIHSNCLEKLKKEVDWIIKKNKDEMVAWQV